MTTTRRIGSRVRWIAALGLLLVAGCGGPGGGGDPDPAGVPDAGDAGDAVSAPDVADAADVPSAPDMADFADLADAADSSSVPDTADAGDAVDVSSVPDAEDVADSSGVPDVADATDAADVPADGPSTPEIPALIKECEACHDATALATAGAGAGKAPGAWAAMAAEGLVRVDPLFPEPGTWWGTPWPRRGVHGSAGACGSCHPLAADGTGHGLRLYPSPQKAFAGATDCAPACHGWVDTGSEVAGFPGAADVPTVTGSLRPGALLAGGTNAHSQLWRLGARPAQQADFRISAFGPGCGGCHNLMAEDHGAALGCLDCHDFRSDSSATHTAHVAAIADNQARFDPQGASAGVTACDYCHAGGATGPTDRSRQACHNCHLSGHAPVGADGLPQFWPVSNEQIRP